MTAETVREVMSRKPFEPLRVVMSSGESYDILHPEWMFITGRALFLAIPDKNHPEGERWVFCSYLHIAHIELLPARPARKAG